MKKQVNTPLYIANRLRGGEGRIGRAGRLTTRIAAVSVAVSILVMLVAVAVVRGFRAEIQAKAQGFSGEILLEAPGGNFLTQRYPTTLKLSYLDSLAALPYIHSVHPFADCSGLIKTSDLIEGCVLKGVDSLYDWHFFASCMEEGRLPRINTLSPSPEVIISKRMSMRTGLHVGEEMLMYFVDENVRVRKFRITGIYNAQFEEVDKHLVMGDLRHVQRLSNWDPDRVDGFEITMAKGHGYKDPVDVLEAFIVAHSTDDDPGVVLRDLRNRYSHLYDWFDLLDLNVFIILFLMILVAGFNMISGLLIMIFEKTSMIGLLKSMGMNNREISACFIWRSGHIVWQGVLWGTLLALAFCWLQQRFGLITLNPENYFVDKVPIRLSLWNIIGVDVLGPLAIMALLLLPLMIIARISPAKTMKVR